MADIPDTAGSKPRPNKLILAVDPARDHILGDPGAEMTLVEYGSYACGYCRAAHEIVAQLRDRFGARMRYTFRHLPLTDRDQAMRAAELAEYASGSGKNFWQVHDVLMSRGPDFDPGELDRIAADLNVPRRANWDPAAARAASGRVRDDALSGLHSGAAATPTFFINGRRYEGAWDESSLAEAMLGSLGHRLHMASLNFVRWGPSTGFLLLLMTVVAVILSNTAVGPAIDAWWHSPFGFQFGERAFSLSVVDWVNHGLLTIFFLVVGLEVKREFTVGRLATRSAATLPILAAIGGMVVPALIYLTLTPPGPLTPGWGLTIATDTAFAVALIVLLGDRVPIDLRVFLTAAVIMDDLVAIAVIAIFYSGEIHLGYIAASVAVTGMLLMLNRWGVYRPLPYAVLGVVLWAALYAAGLHATLAGVILAVAIPTRPPATLNTLLAQAQMIIETETSRRGEALMRHGPSKPALEALDAIHLRIESPADKLLRLSEPWSSYVVLPIFALANAGVAWSSEVLVGHGGLMLAIIAALVIGKPIGIVLGARCAVWLRLAEKPTDYTWRQLAGAGALAGIGFTMSLFIAGQAFSEADFPAAKIAIFIASLLAGVLGVLILLPRVRTEEASPAAPQADAPASTPV